MCQSGEGQGARADGEPQLVRIEIACDTDPDPLVPIDPRSAKSPSSVTLIATPKSGAHERLRACSSGTCMCSGQAASLAAARASRRLGSGCPPPAEGIAGMKLGVRSVGIGGRLCDPPTADPGAAVAPNSGRLRNGCLLTRLSGESAERSLRRSGVGASRGSGAWAGPRQAGRL